MTASWVSLRFAAVAVAVAAVSCQATSARAADVIADWPTIAMPPPPTSKPATVDPKTTALFLFDFMSTNCGERPRCVEAVPRLKALHDRARAANMLVAYTMPGDGKIIDPSIALRVREKSSTRGPADPISFSATTSMRD